MIKGAKLSGIRLVNYHEDNINWKDHADKILAFFIEFKCKEFGFNPLVLEKFKYVEELPNDAKIAYEEWFKNYDFQNDKDEKWIKWLDGKLNFFYHTENPTIIEDNTWLIYMVKAEEKAREIAESGIFHGAPNIDAFVKVEPNTLSSEVSGRRNGYVFSSELANIAPSDTKGFYWAVAFQAPDSVKLYFKDGEREASRIISWAAECTHATLLQITENGRFLVRQVFVKGKAGSEDRNVPQEKVPTKAYTGNALSQYFNKYFYEMYGIWDDIDAEVKSIKTATNARQNAVATMNDEEVNIGKVLSDINSFIKYGNVSKERLEYNKKIRKNIKSKNKERDRQIRSKVREAKKTIRKQSKKDRQKLNPLISKK